jgi:hypothetical protein
MKFRTHNDTQIDINGTSLQGYIQATRAQLERAFGEPDEGGDEVKITTMWTLLYANGEVATIYDWKRYGAGYPKQSELISWHIGANVKRVEAMVHDSFRAAHGLSAPALKVA